MTTDTQPGAERRFWDGDGRPNLIEHALAAVANAHGSPLREEALRWMRSAQVHAQLAQIEAMQDLARSNRELAAAQMAMADEMRWRRENA